MMEEFPANSSTPKGLVDCKVAHIGNARPHLRKTVAPTEWYVLACMTQQLLSEAAVMPMRLGPGWTFGPGSLGPVDSTMTVPSMPTSSGVTPYPSYWAARANVSTQIKCQGLIAMRHYLL